MKSRNLLLCVLLVGSAVACSADHATPGGDGARASAYALAVIVFGPDPSSDMTYVSILHSLDATSVDLQHSFPFPGDADTATYGGKPPAKPSPSAAGAAASSS